MHVGHIPKLWELCGTIPQAWVGWSLKHVGWSLKHGLDNPSSMGWTIPQAWVGRSLKHGLDDPSSMGWMIPQAWVERSLMHGLDDPSSMGWTIPQAWVVWSLKRGLDDPSSMGWTIPQASLDDPSSMSWTIPQAWVGRSLKHGLDDPSSMGWTIPQIAFLYLPWSWVDCLLFKFQIFIFNLVLTTLRRVIHLRRYANERFLLTFVRFQPYIGFVNQVYCPYLKTDGALDKHICCHIKGNSHIAIHFNSNNLLCSFTYVAIVSALFFRDDVVIRKYFSD